MVSTKALKMSSISTFLVLILSANSVSLRVFTIFNKFSLIWQKFGKLVECAFDRDFKRYGDGRCYDLVADPFETKALQRKQLRGDIVTMLYKDFGRPPLPVKTLVFALPREIRPDQR